ncbi:MAG: efflux RND transporter periplasmic adaptor subunit [Syntrophaceae bacterium]|nr:efflux RND transporter periplasmic adaptor subunit [Syntrophaceae bacterium]
MKKNALFRIVLLLVTVLSAAGCGGKEAQHAPPAVPVAAGEAVRKDMPVQIQAVGVVEAYRTVTVVPQVTGQVAAVHFREGQEVRKGDLLFSLDPAPYREELRQAEARLAKEEAQFANSRAEARRYAFLLEKGAVSRSDYDRYQTTEATQSQTVRDNRAAVEKARLNLQYCSIRAPIAGKTGSYGVNPGAVVTANTGTLTTVNQIRPVYVRFSIPENQLTDVRRQMRQSSLKVTTTLPGKEKDAREGVLVFVDNTVDPDSGMIRLKAEFVNPDGFLWPGQFANAALEITIQKNALVVPSPAVQKSQEGHYVFVIKQDKTVAQRPVTVDRVVGPETVLAKGVEPGETVVTDGHLKLREGFPVEIKEVKKATAGKP